MKNEPAYPCVSEDGYSHVGLTKREYFAGLAMQGWLSSFDENTTAKHEGVAQFAVECADALLEALNERK